MNVRAEIDMILRQSARDAQAFEEWRSNLPGMLYGPLRCLDDLPPLIVSSSGHRIDIVTMRLPDQYRGDERAYFLRLLNLTIDYARELYGNEVGFARSEDAQLVVVRFLRPEGFSCYGLLPSRDGNMVRIEVRHGAFIARSEREAVLRPLIADCLWGGVKAWAHVCLVTLATFPLALGLSLHFSAVVLHGWDLPFKIPVLWFSLAIVPVAWLWAPWIWRRCLAARSKRRQAAERLTWATFRMRDAVEGNREVFFMQFPDERNFFARMNEWMQQMQGLADAPRI